MSPEALIFDVDGTLAETEEAHRNAFNRTFEEAGIDWFWTAEDYRRLLKTTGGKERMRRHRIDQRAEWPGDAEIAALHRRKTEIYGEILARRDLELRPGVAELIDSARAHGVRMAIATTTNRPNVDALCDSCWGRPAAEIFEVIAAGDEVDAKKPAPDVFALALERLELLPSRCIALEDSRNGLLSAKAAGLPVLVTPSAYTGDEDFSGATWVVADLTRPNLPDALKFD